MRLHTTFILGKWGAASFTAVLVTMNQCDPNVNNLSIINHCFTLVLKEFGGKVNVVVTADILVVVCKIN